MVTILFRVGNLIEDSAIARSKRDIEALTKIRPNTANLSGRTARWLPWLPRA